MNDFQMSDDQYLALLIEEFLSEFLSNTAPEKYRCSIDWIYISEKNAYQILNNGTDLDLQEIIAILNNHLVNYGYSINSLGLIEKSP